MRTHACLLITFLLCLSGCGNKGDLFLPVDEQTAEELRRTEELLNDAAQNSGTPDEREESKDKQDEKRRVAPAIENSSTSAQ